MRETVRQSLDQSMIEFGRSWFRYGGGSEEDIYIAFGLSARSYFERLRTVLDGQAGASLDEQTRDQIRAVCVRRLR